MSAEVTKDEILDEMAESYLARLRRGEPADVEDYVQVHPEWAEEIRELFDTLSIVESVEDAGEVQPQQIGDYRILRCAGRGGMGVVYEAIQESLGRRVALKVLPRQASLANATYLQRFRREARAVAALHHTNIVPVFGVGEQDGMHYYAMQFIEGQGLDRILAELRRLNGGSGDDARRDTPARSAKTEATEVAQSLLHGQLGNGAAQRSMLNAQLADTSRKVATKVDSPKSSPAAEGSRALHSHPPSDEAPQAYVAKRLTHGGDVRAPSVDGPTESDLAARLMDSRAEYFNRVVRIGIQVAEALSFAHAAGVLHRDIKPSNLLLNIGQTAWITDFGLAKIETGDDLTQGGDILGTLRYLAPERLRGNSDARGDVYSLGLTLYELLTFRPAFDETSRDRLVQQILQEEPPRPRKLDGRIPRDLETIVLKAIAKDPIRRYQTSAELADDLRRFLAQEPIHARRTGAPERLWRWCRRNPAVASLTGTVMLLTIVAAGVATVSALWLREQRDAALVAEQREMRARSRAESEAESARIEALKSRRISEFLQAMLASADPLNSRGDEMSVMEVLDRAAKKLGTDLSDQPEVAAALHDTIGWTYLHLGTYDEADIHLRAALALQRALPESPQLATTLDHLSRLVDATSQVHSEDFQEAMRLAREAVAIRRVLLGPGHPDTIVSVGYLSYLEYRVGSDVSSKNTLGQLASLGGGFLSGGDLQRALKRLRGLWESGQRDEALRFVHETIAPLREKLGPGPALADGLRMIGMQRIYFKDYNSAEPILITALDMNMRSFGPQHPTVAVCQQLVGQALAGNGHYDQAEAMFQKSLTVGRKVLGEHHRVVGEVLFDLGRLYHRKLDRPEDAEEMYRQSLAIRRKALDRKHPDVSRTMQSLGQLLQYRLNKIDEAESLYREALSIRRKTLGDNHRLVAWTIYYLADLLHYNKGDFEEAEGLYRQALAIRQKVLGDEDKYVAETMYHLAVLLESGQHQYSQAESLLHKSLAIRRRIGGDDDQETLRVQNRLARLLANCSDPQAQKPDEALTLAQGLVKRAPQNGSFWSTLGMACYRTADPAAAIEALHKSNKLLGRNSTTNRFFLAMAHWQLEQYDEAKKQYQAAASWMDDHAPNNECLAQYRLAAESLLAGAPVGSPANEVSSANSNAVEP